MKKNAMQNVNATLFSAIAILASVIASASTPAVAQASSSRQIQNGPISQPALPDCGANSTTLGQACYGYLIERANHTFSLSTLPSSYPNIPRCADPSIGRPAKPCMHKYRWVKVTPINKSVQVTNPTSSVEVYLPN